MAGRGTDIILGGNPETMAWAQLQDKYPTRLDVPKEEWDSLGEEIDQREKACPSPVQRSPRNWRTLRHRYGTARIDGVLTCSCVVVVVDKATQEAAGSTSRSKTI